MITIILPGYSPHNKQWADEVKDKLKLDHKIIVHEWEHWKGGSMSVKREKESILREIQNQKVNIIAKSVGTRIAMHLIPIIKNQLNKLILCGIPTKFENEETRELYKNGLLQFSSENVLIVQNKNDPFSPSKIIKENIKQMNSKINILEKDRKDHNYPYFNEFQNFLQMI